MRVGLLRASVAACIVVSTSAAAGGSAETHAADNLIQSAVAGRTTTYQGVVIYRGDDSFDVLKIEHRFKNDSERERLVSLTGEPRQLLRIDNRLISVLPKGKSLSVDRPSLKGLFRDIDQERIDKLKKFYDFRDLGEGRIAGRECTGVGIVPKDALRYGYEIWLDDEKHLPLKVTLVGPHNEVLEQVMFTDISFPASIADDVFEAEVDTNKFNLVARNLPSLDAPATPPVVPDSAVVRLERLPPGFEIIARDERSSPDGQGKVEHILLSDGLSAVSIFTEIQQQTVDNSKMFSGVVHRGPVQAYGRTEGSMHITIVGEVPVQTVRMIGDSLHASLPGPGPILTPAPAAVGDAARTK
jgi:sigma-E factor negative regulatory protein RseB